jgi:FMN phosphatase YigB (HAD superfamily)
MTKKDLNMSLYTAEEARADTREVARLRKEKKSLPKHRKAKWIKYKAEELLCRVKDTAELGCYSFAWSYPIYKETIQILKDLGYTVEFIDNRTVISW